MLADVFSFVLCSVRWFGLRRLFLLGLMLAISDLRVPQIPLLETLPPSRC
jgi:hypothetical protein